MNALPTNGTFLTGLQTGQVFVTAGGAPVYVSSWDAFGGSHPTVGVDQGAIEAAGNAAPLNHLNFHPTSGSFVAVEPSGNVFEILNGHPKYVNSWSQVGGPQPYTTVNDATINGAGPTDTTNPFSHLLQAEANNFTAPTLVGTATVGEVIFASTGVWGPGAPNFTYAWYANGVVVPGQVASDFVPTPAMAGEKITFTVTATEPSYLPQSVTAATQTVAPAPTPATTLTSGQTVVSPNNQYTVIMQSDGNLVLYGNGRALWSTGTANHPGARFIAQGDGNAVVYSSTGQALWNSHTAGRGTAPKFEVLSTGNLELVSTAGTTW